MFNEDATPDEGLKFFFERVWREQPGYVYLPTQDPKTDEWRAVMYKWPDHQPHVIKHVLQSTAKGLNVFFAPAIFKEAKPKKEYVLGSHVVWTDFDGNAPQDWPQEGQNGASHGLPDVPAPSMRIQSSVESHEHVYWELDSFETDVSHIEGINRSLSYTCRADTSGWDANQILRPPYTTNYKHDLPVTIARFDDRRKSIQAFDSLKPILQLVSDSVDTENLPTVEHIIAKYPWDEEHFQMFMDPQIPEGKRSSALMRLGYFGAELGMTDSEIYSLLENADSRWGKFKKRSDRKKRLLDIVNRARLKHPNATTDLTFKGLLSIEQQDRVQVNQQTVYGFKDFMAAEINVDWVLEELLEIGGFGMIASAPGVGKTQLALQMACTMAIGKEDFIGYKVTKRQKVVFFSLEMGQVALRLLLNTIVGHYTEDEQNLLQESLLIVPLGESLPVARNESLQFVKSVLDDAHPTVVLFDSLSKLTGGKFDAEGSSKVNEFYASIRGRYGSCVVVIHHNRKANGDNKRPTRLEDIYGEVFLTTDMTFVLTLWREEGAPRNEVEINVVKSRLHPEREPAMFIKNEHLFYEPMSGESSTAVGAGFMAGQVEVKPKAEGGQDVFTL